METKLTLRVNRLTIDRAKAYAREHRTSISRMVQTYLDAVTFPRDEDMDITPLVKSLSGVIKSGGVAKPGDSTKPGDMTKPADSTKPGDSTRPSRIMR